MGSLVPSPLSVPPSRGGRLGLPVESSEGSSPVLGGETNEFGPFCDVISGGENCCGSVAAELVRGGSALAAFKSAEVISGRSATSPSGGGSAESLKERSGFADEEFDSEATLGKDSLTPTSFSRLFT